MSVCVVVRAMYCANTDELQMIIVVAEVSVAVAEKRILQISACIRWIVLQKIRSELRLLLQGISIFFVTGFPALHRLLENHLFTIN